MYRCSDNIKGCLSVSAYKVGGNLYVIANKNYSDVRIIANRIGNTFKVEANPINKELNLSVRPIGKKILVTCSLICTINKSAYLNVNPDYVWLTPDMLASGEFEIISNVNWNIV